MGAHSRKAQFVADVVAGALEVIESGESPTAFIAVRLGEAIHADSSSYGWMDVESGECHLDTWPDVIDLALLLRATAEIPHWHPVLDYWLAGNTGVAAVSTLVTDQRAWRNGAAYGLLKRGLGCTETGGIRLSDAGHTLRMIGFARHKDFTPDELRLVATLRGPAVALTRHADWLATIAHEPASNTARQTAANIGLTTRELGVLQLLADGLLASSIANRLAISTRTVHKHLANIYGKLDTHDRLTTVVQAQQMGLLPAPRDSSTASSTSRLTVGSAKVQCSLCSAPKFTRSWTTPLPTMRNWQSV